MRDQLPYSFQSSNVPKQDFLKEHVLDLLQICAFTFMSVMVREFKKAAMIDTETKPDLKSKPSYRE